jgi:hypothetical protein
VGVAAAVTTAGCGLRSRQACGLTRKCSRQAGGGRRSVRAWCSSRPNSGSIDWCGREDDCLQLICNSLGVQAEWI